METDFIYRVLAVTVSPHIHGSKGDVVLLM
jgi:hypothetical protein